MSDNRDFFTSWWYHSYWKKSYVIMVFNKVMLLWNSNYIVILYGIFCSAKQNHMHNCQVTRIMYSTYSVTLVNIFSMTGLNGFIDKKNLVITLLTFLYYLYNKIYDSYHPLLSTCMNLLSPYIYITAIISIWNTNTLVTCPLFIYLIPLISGTQTR